MRFGALITILLLSLVALPSAAFAQRALVVSEDAPLFLNPTPKPNTTPVLIIERGVEVDIVRVEGAWAIVRVADSRGDLRSGYVESRLLQRVAPPPERIRAGTAPEAPLPQTAARQTAQPAGRRNAPANVYLNFNYLSITPQQDVQAYALQRTISLETATFATAYPKLPRVTAPEIAVDFRFGSDFGIGIGGAWIEYEYNVGLVANVPHPTRFNTFGQDATATNGRLQRRDLSIDIQAAYYVPTSDAVVVKVFGGPTYFKVSQEMVDNIRYTQTFNLLGANNIDITTYTQQEVKGSAWGFNVGVDAAYFFSRYVGVGGTVRHNRANVSIDAEPLTGQSVDLKAGGTTLGGGLRLRF